jgi:sigma-B regulation protein RsbU (phosphoserine phosphatase)
LQTILSYGIGYTLNYKLNYASAGHPAAVIIKKENEIQLLKNTGGLIGISPQKKYNALEFTFTKNDRLFIFTDGIFEQFVGEEDFGEDRLYKILAEDKGNTINNSVDLVLSELQTFLGDTDIQDDITLMGIRYRG